MIITIMLMNISGLKIWMILFLINLLILTLIIIIISNNLRANVSWMT